MQTRTLLVIVFAVLFGVIAALGAFFKQSGGSPHVEMVSVAVVTADLVRGTELTKELVSMRSWPKDNVPVDAMTDLEEVIGRSIIMSLAKNEPIVASRLGMRGGGKGMDAIVPVNMRAVTIQTPNIATGVAGFVLPGTKVDVVLTITPQGADDGSGGGTTVTLLQNVEVLAVDQKIEAPTDRKMDPKELRSVTLLVSPRDAEKVDLGQNKGTMRLTLRNPLDDLVQPVPRTTMRQLRSGNYDGPAEDDDILASKPKKNRSVRPTSIQIVTFRGPEASVVTLAPRRRAAESGGRYSDDSKYALNEEAGR